jgi:hypothetical protein
MIMSALLTDKTTAKPPRAGLHPRPAGLLKMVQKTLSALLARHLRRIEAELVSFDRRMLKDIGFGRSEIGSLVMDDALKRTNGVRRNSCRDPVSGR